MAERYGQYGQNRFWEMILGILVWITLVGALVSALVYPLGAVIFIIIFDLYWVFRVFYFVILVFLAYSRYRRTTKVNWTKKLQEVDGWEEIYHIVMLPTYKEDVSIVRKAIQGVIDSGYPMDKFLVAVGGEEGDKEYFAEVEKQMRKEFDGVFDIVDAEYSPKPEAKAFDLMVKKFQIDPTETLYIEDIAKNLSIGKERGAKTVWLINDEYWGKKESDKEYIDYKIENLSLFLKEIRLLKNS